MTKTLGITVLGDFILSEGVEPIIQRLLDTGVTAVACNPTVTAEAPEGQGTFQPPADAGSSPRVFDRPLFGKTSLWVHSGPSFHPNEKLYENCRYGPREVNALTEQHGHVIGEFIDKAADAGLKVYLQVGAVQPTGLREDDQPRLPDGLLAKQRMAKTGSLASVAIRDYNRAYAQDLSTHYPRISGFRIDWPEYPCYTLDEAFGDFGPHVADWANRHGFEFDSIRFSIQALGMWLDAGLSNDYLRSFIETRDVNRLIADNPPIGEWLRMKAALSTDLIRDWHDIIRYVGPPGCELVAHAFMPPYSCLTGFDFKAAAKHCDAIAPKFYTMHWPLMVRFWANAIAARNTRLDLNLLVHAIALLMELGEPAELAGHLDRMRYPEPDEAHPVSANVQRKKIESVRNAMNGSSAELIPLVHGYGPIGDFSSRFELAVTSDVDGVWINRYGYLTNEKLRVVGDIWRQNAAN
jgi:hypothetical protein